jgi:hypothetical protein
LPERRRPAGEIASRTGGIDVKTVATGAKIDVTFGKTDEMRCATAGGAIVSKTVGIGARIDATGVKTFATAAKIAAIVVASDVYERR